MKITPYIGALPATLPRIVENLDLTETAAALGTVAVVGCSGISIMGCAMGLGASAVGYLAWRNSRKIPQPSQPQTNELHIVEENTMDEAALEAARAAAAVSAYEQRLANDLIKPWMHMVLTLDAGENPPQAIRTVQRELSNLIRQGDYQGVDEVLQFFSPDKISLGLATVLFALTRQHAIFLPSHVAFSDKFRRKAIAAGKSPREMGLEVGAR